MKILQTETLFNWGGEQNKVLNEMLLMRELGHEVGLFCNPKSEIESRAKEQGFHIITQEMSKKNYHQSVPALSKAIKDFGAELVISHGSTDSWVAAIAGLKWRKKGVKFARERHNSFEIKGLVSRFMHKNLFDFIIAVSPAVVSYLEKIGVKKVFFLPSAVNVAALNAPKSTFKDEFNIPQNAVTIGMFSSLYKEKGVFDFAAAIAPLMGDESLHFIFGGDNDENVSAEILAPFSDKERSRIHFTGFRKDKENVIAGIDIFVFPSHSEGLPNALLEAMALRRAVVAFDIEPMNMLLDTRGVCVPFGDTQAMSAAIKGLLGDRQKASVLGQKAYDFVLENYDISSLKNNLKKLLEF